MTLNSGEHVTCTFTNTEYGSITVVKDAVATRPRIRARTSRSSRRSARFALDDDADPTLSDTRPSVSLARSVHVVESLGLPGWALTGLTCTPGGDRRPRQRRRDHRPRRGRGRHLHVHEHPEQATLTIVKDALPDGPQDFAFTTTR